MDRSTRGFAARLDMLMGEHKVRSGIRLAREISVDSSHVLDWIGGDAVPTDDQCEALVRYFGLDAEVVRRHRNASAAWHA